MTAGSEARSAAGAEEVFAIIRAAIARVMEIDPAGVQRTTDLVDDLGADSLALVEIVEIVEEQLAGRAGRAFQIPDEQVDELRTVGQTVDYALAVLAQQPGLQPGLQPGQR